MKYINLFVVVLLFASCNYSSNKNTEKVVYNKDGLSFKHSKYWEIEEDRPVKNTPDSRFISISDTEPFHKDGSLIITAVDSSSTSDKVLDNLMNQMKISFSKRNIEFGLEKQPYNLTIGEYKTLRADFVSKVLSKRSKGSLTVFNHNGKTYSFVFRIDVKDKVENFTVVDSVISSLKIK